MGNYTSDPIKYLDYCYFCWEPLLDIRQTGYVKEDGRFHLACKYCYAKAAGLLVMEKIV